MNLKKLVTIFIISFGVGFFLTYVISHIVIISTVIGSLAGVVIALWQFFEEDRLSYSNLLIKELKFKASSLIEFSDDHSLTLFVKIVKPSGIPAYEDYSQDVDILIEHNYPILRKCDEKRKACIKAHNDLAKDFMIDIVSDIQTEFRENSITDWDLNVLNGDICKAIKSYYNGKMFDFNTLDMEPNRRQIVRTIILNYLSSSNFPLNKLNEPQYRKLNQKLPFDALRDYKSKAENHNTGYVNEINGLIQKVAKGIPIDSVWDSLKRQLHF
jgi:hypothetical protein